MVVVQSLTQRKDGQAEGQLHVSAVPFEGDIQLIHQGCERSGFASVFLNILHTRTGKICHVMQNAFP